MPWEEKKKKSNLDDIIKCKRCISSSGNTHFITTKLRRMHLLHPNKIQKLFNFNFYNNSDRYTSIPRAATTSFHLPPLLRLQTPFTFSSPFQATPIGIPPANAAVYGGRRLHSRGGAKKERKKKRWVNGGGERGELWGFIKREKCRVGLGIVGQRDGSVRACLWGMGTNSTARKSRGRRGGVVSSYNNYYYFFNFDTACELLFLGVVNNNKI